MKTTSKHSPGPWDLEELDYDTNVPAGSGWYLHFDAEGGDTLWIPKAHCTEANAQLMATAPETLSMLKRLVDTIEIHSVSDSSLVDEVTALIDKAEGRS
mgnify:FL=1